MKILKICAILFSVLSGLILGWGCVASSPAPIPHQIETTFISPLPNPPDGIAVNPTTGYVYAIQFPRYVSVLQDNQMLTTISLPHWPQQVGVNPNNAWVYVLQIPEGWVTIIDKTEVVTSVTVGGNMPRDIAISKGTGLVYVVSAYEKQDAGVNSRIRAGYLTVISGTQIIDNILLGKLLAVEVTVDPFEEYVYVGTVDGEVLVFKDGQEVARYDMGSAIKSMATDPRTGDVYALYRASTLKTLSHFSKGELIESINVEGEKGAVQRLAVHPTSGDVYVIDLTRQEVIVVRNMKVIARPKVDWYPKAIDIDPVTGNVYVTTYGFNKVNVIQGTEVITKIPVGTHPLGIAVNPNNGWVYVSNELDGTVTVLGFPEEETTKVE